MEFEKSAHPNPWEKANFVSRTFFWWLAPLFLKGNKGNLKLSDIYDCPKFEKTERMGDMLQKEWNKELRKQQKGQKPSLIKAVIRTFGFSYCLNGILTLFETCFIHIMKAVFLGFLLQHFNNLNSSSEEVYLYSAGICLVSALFVFTSHSFIFTAQRIGMRLRVACSTLIYKKALKLSHSALRKTSVGQMVNLLSNDVNRFDEFAIFLPYLVCGPLQIAIIIGVLWQHIGYACVAGVSVMLLYIPLQGCLGKMFSKIRLQTALLTDERIKLMNELVAGMRVIKMFAWENPFAGVVNSVRRKEMKKVWHSSIIKSFNKSLSLVAPSLILFLSFLVYTLVKEGDLTPDKVFVSIILFDSLVEIMAWRFPTAVSEGAGAITSLKRIEEFLLLQEQQESSWVNVSTPRPKLSQCGVWMYKVVASWKEDGNSILENISLDVRSGELLAIVGPCGCGKSSLLLSLLGEMPIKSGEVALPGKISYASQEQWVFDGSVKQNVLFESNFDEKRYREVLKVCALDKDIELFPYGDSTLVGERGVSLSGGQKARINLARALYFDADIYLLDDPLSAVDAAVSKHLFEKCINGFLKDKVRILVTHQIQYLKDATQILVLKEGKCLALGTYQQLQNDGMDFGSLMDTKEEGKKKRLTSTVSQDSNLSDGQNAFENTTVPLNMPKGTVSSSTLQSYDQVQGEKALPDAPKRSEEMKSSGAVGLKLYREYVASAASPVLLIISVFSFIIIQALSNGSNYWLTLWANEEQMNVNRKTCFDHFHNGTFLSDNFEVSHEDCMRWTNWFDETLLHVPGSHRNLFFYLAFVLSMFIFSIMMSTSFFTICMRASVNLHDKMFRCVFRVPISFFESNSLGRILNRFSKDVGIIDDLIPITAIEMIYIFGILLGNLIMVVIVQPWLILTAIFLGIIFVLILRFYLPTARDVKRFEGIRRSPVFSHLSNSLNGLTTIRALKVQRSFEMTFNHHQDRHTSTWFTFLSVTRWLGIVMDWLCVILLCIVTATMVILAKDESYASFAALGITSVIHLSGYFQYGVIRISQLESEMTSVERVKEYSNLKSEDKLQSTPDKKPPGEWPQKGAISFENVSLSYNENDPPVLKNLTFSIEPKEKIGIVGRTGAGKSSMIESLFRMKEPDGVIRIDGWPTRDLGLHDLRKKISIIPQDPVLFTGCVRRNLDPFKEHSDEELWQALEEAYIKEVIQELPAGLDTYVAEGGNNFSVGQRQLMCLARAILRRNKILVLDEATANVDSKTDNLIQQTIRTRFKDCTVLTVAHRLNTVMDADRVLVLDEGRVKEYDRPHQLLKNRDSHFSHLVQMTGPAMAQQLRDVACQAYYTSCRLRNECNEPEVNVFGGTDDMVTMNNAEVSHGIQANGVHFIVPEEEHDDEDGGCINEAFETENMPIN